MNIKGTTRILSIHHHPSTSQVMKRTNQEITPQVEEMLRRFFPKKGEKQTKHLGFLRWWFLNEQMLHVFTLPTLGSFWKGIDVRR